MQTIDEIYQKYAQMVYRYLLSMTYDTTLAEDLMQETFFQAIRSLDRYDGSCKISTWLCAIAKNQLIVYRRKHPQEDNLDEIEKSTLSPELDVIEKISHIELMKKMHACPEPFREIMYLRIYGGLSFKEIGEVFGKSENWARVTYYRGKERLRKELEIDEE